MSYDSIIIGAGLSGLTCALLLGRSGRKVLVLEQNAHVAPLVRGFNRNGLYFDSGFHYAGGLGDDGPLDLFFRHLGLAGKLNLFPFAQDGFDGLRLSATGQDFFLPVGLANIETVLSDRFPQAREKISAFLLEVSSRWRNFPYLDLDVDLADFGIKVVHGMSLQERLREFEPWPQLQGILSMHSLLYGLPPESVSVSFNAVVAGSYYHSAHGIVGGGRSLINAFQDLLAEADVEILCNKDVAGVLTGNHGVSGVRLTSGEEFPAGEVVATLNPGLLPQLFPPGTFRPAYSKRLINLRQTSSAYIGFFRTRGTSEFLRGRNLFIQSHPGIFNGSADQALEERSFYVTGADQGSSGGINGVVCIVPARYDEVSCWQAPGPGRPEGYIAWKKEIGERLLTMLKKSCPEISEPELVELGTPLTFCRYSRANEGAVYGTGHWLGQYNPHPATRLPGLFLSGQAVTAPGLLGAITAAYLTCGSILGHEHLRGELRTCR
ncbi:MAG: NAD(P)/FAD-dependent oxidoreductase [Deltaproteobacteria bacterium]|nr:NAD(P)/FAD-dependent oxidoreductase [Deltaproteobacteria bacterium]